MKDCRKALSLQSHIHKSILSVEFLIITKILSRRQTLASCCFMFSFLHQFTDGRLFRYVRLIEFGDDVGLGDAILTRGTSAATIVVDHQYTLDTQTQLSKAKQSRGETSDMTLCLSEYQLLIQACEKAPIRLGIQCILFLHGSFGEHKSCFNISSSFVDSIKDGMMAQQKFNLCQAFVPSFLNRDLTLQDQFTLLNCMEPKFVHFPYVKGPLSWNSMSLKHGLLENCLDEIRSMQSQHNVTKYKHFRKGSHHGSNHRSHHPSLQRSCFVELKSQFVSRGFFRVLIRDSTRLSVVWNAYDPCSG